MCETLRVMKPGAFLFFTVPFVWPLHDVPYDEYRYTPFSLGRHLSDSGFVNVTMDALGGWDRSLAQMIGLWVRRRPMSPSQRSFLTALAGPLVQWLNRKDTPPREFAESCMITGIAGTAHKPS